VRYGPVSHYHPRASDRGKGLVGAALFTGAIGWVLVSGLTGKLPLPAAETITLVDMIPAPKPAPPPVPKPLPQPAHKRPSGAAAPPNLRNEPTELVAPKPQVPLPVTPPVVVAPVAGVGSAASAGSADVAGPGTGAGGVGNGRGSGGYGDGDGDGGGTPPRQIRGRLSDADYPKSAGREGAGGTVEVRFLVATSGRVTECVIDRSSGNADLDATTCRLIQERYRFRPCLDRDGGPVECEVVENHTWEVRRDPRPDDR
jgi:periplasmic protein TonB